MAPSSVSGIDGAERPLEMMRWIVQSSLKIRFIVIALAVAMMLFGTEQLRGMPVDVFPEFSPPRVEIQTACLGLSAEEVESLITVPLEQALNGVPGLDVMRSKSVAQLSSIVLIFEPGTDLLNARQLVQERMAITAPTLPSWAAPPVMLQPLSATSRVMKIGLTSDNMSQIDLSMTAYWKIRPRLLREPGVAHVAIWGQRQEMLHVQVDPERLKEHGVTLDQVMRASSDALDAGLLTYSSGSSIGTGGFIDTPNQRMGVNHVLPIVSPESLSQIVIQKSDGSTILMGEISDIVIDHQLLSGDAVINDGPGLMLIVEKLPWGNTLDVTRGVEDALAELQPGLVGIEVDSTIFRPASFVEIALENLVRALIVGLVFVTVILVLFLFDWRSALISLVAIPLSLVAAGLVLYLRDTTINTMVLAGLVIAVGVVVDDAIIDIENIMRRLRQYRAEGSDKSTASIILEASVEVRSAIIYATLIDAVAVMPVFFMEGLTGAFFRPLAISYALAVIASMAVAMTVTPALAFILLSRGHSERHTAPFVPWLQRRYTALLQRIIRRPRWAYAMVTVVALIGLTVTPLLGQSMLPDFKERDFLMHWVGTPGTSHPEMVRITTLSSQELRSIPGVRNFGAHIGQAQSADEVVGMNFAENWISVDPNADYDDTLAAVHETVDGYPGLYRDVQTYLKERIREVLAGSSNAVVIRIYGEDLEELRSIAAEINLILGDIDGVVEEHVELQANIPQLDIQVDLQKAAAYGLKPGDVRRDAGTYIASFETGDLWTHGRIYDIRVIGEEELRHSVSSVENLMIDTPDGGQVRLGDIASVQIASTPNEIRHENLARRIDVSANVQGRDLGSVVGELEERLEDIEFPLGYHAELLGEYQERQAADARLMYFSIAAAVGIFLLLQISFNSFRLGLLSFLTLPSALVGGALAAYLGDGVISLGSLVGFLTVLGIAARNGIMMITHFQHLEREEGMEFGPELVLRGARERLSPILMTALATGLALVPLVWAGSIPGHEIEHPMAVVILGGLVTSTLLNLFLVPSLYLRFGKGRNSNDGSATPPVGPEIATA
jgi:CzcA family heavy metal efflux pump